MNRRDLVRPAHLGIHLVVHAGAAAVVGSLLIAAGQPIFTDDLWWHLALGENYLQHGPWLSADPLLHAAREIPAPAAWLFDVAMAGCQRAFGLQALRVLHVGIVAGLLALVWSIARRAASSAALASAITALAACAMAYRAVQLRPELLSIGLLLILYRLVIEQRAAGSAVSGRRTATAVGLLWLWANLHSGFLLGPILIGAALVGVAGAGIIRGQHDGARLRSLTSVLLLGLLATLANPDGVGQHLAYLHAGVDTPELTRIADEWAGLQLFKGPRANLLPSPFGWALAWVLVVATPIASLLAIRAWRSGAERAPDPALVAMALASLVAMIVAVRFLWLAIFPLLLLLQVGRMQNRPGRGPAAAWVAAAIVVFAAPGFWLLGDWPMISRALSMSPRAATTYLRPYPATKYYTHAVWFMRDAGLTGRLSNQYFHGGFLGFWLAPELKAFVNGSLNVPKTALDAVAAIQRRGGRVPDERFVDLLDAYDVNVFLGIGLPQRFFANRPSSYSTTHLENERGWVQVFRNLDSAVYLRDEPANRANFERVQQFYDAQGIPFDRVAGFDVRATIVKHPDWARRHGLLPVGFERLIQIARGNASGPAKRARAEIASTQALLGLYTDAARSAERVLRDDPDHSRALRVLLFSLLHAGETDAAQEGATRFASVLGEALPTAIAKVAELTRAGEADAARALIVRLPLLTRAEAGSLRTRVPVAEMRTARR